MPVAEGDRHVMMLFPELGPCVDCPVPDDLAASRRGAVDAVQPAGRGRRLAGGMGAAGD